jgi:hypothetical protein
LKIRDLNLIFEKRSAQAITPEVFAKNPRLIYFVNLQLFVPRWRGTSSRCRESEQFRPATSRASVWLEPIQHKEREPDNTPASDRYQCQKKMEDVIDPLLLESPKALARSAMSSSYFHPRPRWRPPVSMQEKMGNIVRSAHHE